VLYVLAFLPFELQKAYVIEWVFILIAVIGLVVLLGSASRDQLWPKAGLTAGGVLLLTYLVYWFFLAGKVEPNRPELGFGGLLVHAGQDVVAVINHRLSTGAIWGATRTAYLEFVMPVLQLVFVVLLFRRVRRGSS
jgi:hypothetical protein